MTKYTDIIKRLETAEGPDRELDWRIADILDIPEKWVESTLWPPFMKGSTIDKRISHYTASIDAAMALVERVLPSVNCYGFDKDTIGTDAYVSRNNVKSGHWIKEAFAKTVPIAILLAAFRALEAQEAKQ